MNSAFGYLPTSYAIYVGRYIYIYILFNKKCRVICRMGNGKSNIYLETEMVKMKSDFLVAVILRKRESGFMCGISGKVAEMCGNTPGTSGWPRFPSLG